MTDEQQQDQPAATREPALTRSERIFLRISIWQTVLSVVGLFVAAIALYAALTESEAVRRQTAASVWPYVQLTVADHEGADRAEFRLTLANAGVGPAKVHAMRVTVDGVAQRTWPDVIRAMGADESVEFGQAFVENRVLSPGERVDIFTVTDRGVTRTLREAVARGAGTLEYCYCLIFDDCWMAGSSAPDAPHRSVRNCPDHGDESFQGGRAAALTACAVLPHMKCCSRAASRRR
ncbi:MAG: hypothetical protein R3C16_06190 [Hyphomonadaceae bacterium]